MHKYHYIVLSSHLLIFMLLSLPGLAQRKTREERYQKVFERTAERRDPIEGIWVLNVKATMYYEGIAGYHEIRENKSQWAIKKVSKGKYNVMDIGKDFDDGKMNFEAYFEESGMTGVYAYTCHFNDPEWTAKAHAILRDDMLEYEYFVSKEYMARHYGADYDKASLLHWQFIWTRKAESISNNELITGAK